jgi:hypothetical protein
LRGLRDGSAAQHQRRGEKNGFHDILLDGTAFNSGGIRT